MRGRTLRALVSVSRAVVYSRWFTDQKVDLLLDPERLRDALARPDKGGEPFLANLHSRHASQDSLLDPVKLLIGVASNGNACGSVTCWRSSSQIRSIGAESIAGVLACTRSWRSALVGKRGFLPDCSYRPEAQSNVFAFLLRRLAADPRP